MERHAEQLLSWYQSSFSFLTVPLSNLPISFISFSYSPSVSLATPSFHPALTVNNIRNFIAITLEMEKVQYSSWAELFKIHCHVYKVIDHILPKPTTSATNQERMHQVDEAAGIDKELWSRLDAVVLQWIYCTISNDLLHTIIETDAIAQQAWERLTSIF